MANARLLLARMKKNISAYPSKITPRYRGVPSVNIDVVSLLRTDQDNHRAQSASREDESETGRVEEGGPLWINAAFALAQIGASQTDEA